MFSLVCFLEQETVFKNYKQTSPKCLDNGFKVAKNKNSYIYIHIYIYIYIYIYIAENLVFWKQES